MPASFSSAVSLSKPRSGSCGGKEQRCAWQQPPSHGLETVDLDGFPIKAQAFLLVGQEVLNILALVSLQLDHLSHLIVGDDSSIAGKLLLDDFENLLLVKLLGQALDRG